MTGPEAILFAAVTLWPFRTIVRFDAGPHAGCGGLFH
jgi:hypothetical protein